MKSNMELELTTVLSFLNYLFDLRQQATDDFHAAMERNHLHLFGEIERSHRYYRRRKKTLYYSMVAAVTNIATPTAPMQSRPQSFWSSTQHLSDERWKDLFRMTRETFEYLMAILAPSLTRQTTNSQTAIDPQWRAAIGLWWLATPGEYSVISSLFGVGLRTVRKIVRQVIDALMNTSFQRFISMPTGERLDATVAGFLERGYPQCAGAIGSTHIPITAPTDHADDYRNTRGWHSIILQAAVDHRFW